MSQRVAENFSGGAMARRLVYIVDDDLEVRTSTLFFLSTQNLVGNAFESGCAFLDQVNNLAPSPILLDMMMPVMSGLELLAELRNREIHWPVIVLTGHGAIESTVIAMKLGAVDFLEKPVAGVRTMAALDLAFKLLDVNQQNESACASARARVECLTVKQAAVIKRLLQGLSNRQVAVDLLLSPRTVEMHRATAFSKMGVRNIAEAGNLFGVAHRLHAHA